MHYWVYTDPDFYKDKQMTEAWERYKQSLPPDAIQDDNKQYNDYQDAYDENTAPLPPLIGLNTADSATLVRLKGIGPKSVEKILNRRKTIGPFTDVGQIREVCKISNSTFNILKKHLVIDTLK